MKHDPFKKLHKAIMLILEYVEISTQFIAQDKINDCFNLSYGTDLDFNSIKKWILGTNETVSDDEISASLRTVEEKLKNGSMDLVDTYLSEESFLTFIIPQSQEKLADLTTLCTPYVSLATPKALKALEQIFVENRKKPTQMVAYQAFLPRKKYSQWFKTSTDNNDNCCTLEDIKAILKLNLQYKHRSLQELAAEAIVNLGLFSKLTKTNVTASAIREIEHVRQYYLSI